MKKFIAIILVIIAVISFSLTGCSGSVNSYIVHIENVIKIGVLVSKAEDTYFGSKVLEGVEYAAQLAPTVNMNGKYSVQLSVCDVNDNLTDSVSKFAQEKVCAVICAPETKAKSDEIIEAFSDYDTPLLFVGCYSDEVISDNESFVMSVPYSYQTSTAASYLTTNGFNKGTVIHSDDDYNTAFADLFNTTFVSNGGTSVELLTEYDAETIAKSDSDFVFIIGEPSYTFEVYDKLNTAKAVMPIVVSEIFDETKVETSKYNNMLYVSKFEVDVNNYIGTDFFSVYSTAKNITEEDVTSAEGYGYDAYMLIYGALMGFNSSLNSEEESNIDGEITTTDMLSAVKEIVHLGVTDSISFNDEGLLNPNFLYMSTILNSQSIMLNRFDYANESAQ